MPQTNQQPNNHNSNSTQPASQVANPRRQHYLNPKLTFAILGILLLAAGGFFVWQNYSFKGLTDQPGQVGNSSMPAGKICADLEQKIKAEIEASNHCTVDNDCVIYDQTVCHVGCYFFYNQGVDLASLQAKINDYTQDCGRCLYKCGVSPQKIKCKNNKCVDIRLEKRPPEEANVLLGENQELLDKGILLEFGPRFVSTSKGLFYVTIAHVCEIEDQLLLKKVEITNRGGKVIKSFDVNKELATTWKQMQELLLLIEQDKNKLRTLGATEEALEQWYPSDPATGILMAQLSEKIRKNYFTTGYFEVDLSTLKEPLEWGDQIPVVINIYLAHSNYSQDFIKEVLVEYRRHNLPAEEISVITDKSEYKQGEKIKITIKNNLDSPIWYAKAAQCGTHFWLLQDCQGKEIPYYIPCTWEDYSHHFTKLSSREILEGQWSGLILDENYELKIADPGCYNLVFPYTLNEKLSLGQGWEDDMLKVYSDELRIKVGENAIQLPSLITPPCGTETTNRLIPFGWRPVDYDSKHLIQIDNNSDFSSPEIEEYETGGGIFQPTTPFKPGTYYWRVKSTKLEQEKCLPPPCAPDLNNPSDPCSEAIKEYNACKKQYSNWTEACQVGII